MAVATECVDVEMEDFFHEVDVAIFIIGIVFQIIIQMKRAREKCPVSSIVIHILIEVVPVVEDEDECPILNEIHPQMTDIVTRDQNRVQMIKDLHRC